MRCARRVPKVGLRARTAAILASYGPSSQPFAQLIETKIPGGTRLDSRCEAGFRGPILPRIGRFGRSAPISFAKRNAGPRLLNR